MEARAIQRMVRQSPRKMRLVVDQTRGRAVPEAYAILRFSKKRAARQIHKVLKSAVANAEQHAQRQNVPLDVDRLWVTHAVVNQGTTLKRFTSAAMGRATPVLKRTSHVEIRVAEAAAPAHKPAPAPAAAPATPAAPARQRAGKTGQRADPGPSARGKPTRKKAAKPAARKKKKAGAKPRRRSD